MSYIEMVYPEFDHNFRSPFPQRRRFCLSEAAQGNYILSISMTGCWLAKKLSQIYALLVPVGFRVEIVGFSNLIWIY